MPESATIILFPAPKPPLPDTTQIAAPPREPTPAEARLTRALANLNEAVTAQRAAVAAWKASLGALSAATGRLGTSLRGYHDTLGQLDARVATIRAESAKLKSWADDTITKQG